MFYDQFILISYTLHDQASNSSATALVPVFACLLLYNVCRSEGQKSARGTTVSLINANMGSRLVKCCWMSLYPMVCRGRRQVVTALSVLRNPPYSDRGVGGPYKGQVGWWLLCQSCVVLLVVPGAKSWVLVMRMCVQYKLYIQIEVHKSRVESLLPFSQPKSIAMSLSNLCVTQPPYPYIILTPVCILDIQARINH